MSTLRKRFRITIDEVPHDIVTSARDFVDVDFENASASLATWTMLHAACLRLDVAGVPHDLDKFIDLLDNIEDLDGIPYGVSENPTEPEHSGDLP
jgi:hypothetical protein